MSPSIELIANVIREQIGVAPGTLLSPRALAEALHAVPVPGPIYNVDPFGSNIYFNDTLERCQQDYQIARGACVVAIRMMGRMREVSSHDLAVVLCGVSTAPEPGIHVTAPVRLLRVAGMR